MATARVSMPRGFGTIVVHAGMPHDSTTGTVIAPISLSTTFAQPSPGVLHGEFEYSRACNPNRLQLEQAIAALEHANFAVAFSSGSAAIALVLQALATGSHVISVADIYGGTHRCLTKVAMAHDVRVTFTTDIEGDLERTIQKDTKLVWIETPSNPTLTLVDIRAVAFVAHRHGILVVVDNTFLSPYIHNPLQHGADVVVHSVTKWIAGHSDVVMGVAAINCRSCRTLGLKTLHLQARAASNNAMAIARMLEHHPEVLAVNYPGLTRTKLQRSIIQKQHNSGLGGGILSFRIKGGPTAAIRFCQEMKIFSTALSLGGVESLCKLPCVMTHAGTPKRRREETGVHDDLIRLSCSVEETEDLVQDVSQALESAGVASENARNSAEAEVEDRNRSNS